MCDACRIEKNGEEEIDRQDLTAIRGILQYPHACRLGLIDFLCEKSRTDEPSLFQTESVSYKGLYAHVRSSSTSGGIVPAINQVVLLAAHMEDTLQGDMRLLTRREKE
jgi:hypothetical protein